MNRHALTTGNSLKARIIRATAQAEQKAARMKNLQAAYWDLIDNECVDLNLLVDNIAKARTDREQAESKLKELVAVRRTAISEALPQ